MSRAEQMKANRQGARHAFSAVLTHQTSKTFPTAPAAPKHSASVSPPLLFLLLLFSAPACSVKRGEVALKVKSGRWWQSMAGEDAITLQPLGCVPISHGFSLSSVRADPWSVHLIGGAAFKIEMHYQSTLKQRLLSVGKCFLKRIFIQITCSTTICG